MKIIRETIINETEIEEETEDVIESFLGQDVFEEIRKNLKPREFRFCEEYVKDYRGGDAATRAGYSERSGFVPASRLLNNNKWVQMFIREYEKNLSTRFINTKEKILKEMSLLAHSDLADYDEKLAQRFPSQVTRAIKKYKLHVFTRILAKDGKEGMAGDRLVDENIEIELWDKKGALELMGKEIGMFRERRELTGPDGQPLQIGGPVTIVYEFVDADKKKEDDNAG